MMMRIKAVRNNDVITGTSIYILEMYFHVTATVSAETCSFLRHHVRVSLTVQRNFQPVVTRLTIVVPVEVMHILQRIVFEGHSLVMVIMLMRRFSRPDGGRRSKGRLAQCATIRGRWVVCNDAGCLLSAVVLLRHDNSGDGRSHCMRAHLSSAAAGGWGCSVIRSAFYVPARRTRSRGQECAMLRDLLWKAHR